MTEASLVAQMVKNLLAMQDTQVQPLGWEDPLEKRMATHFMMGLDQDSRICVQNSCSSFTIALKIDLRCMEMSPFVQAAVQVWGVNHNTNTCVISDIVFLDEK